MLFPSSLSQQFQVKMMVAQLLVGGEVTAGSENRVGLVLVPKPKSQMTRSTPAVRLCLGSSRGGLG